MKIQIIGLLTLLFSFPAHAEFSMILTNCEFTSTTPEQQALDYVQIRRTYESVVGSDNPQDQITYSGLMFRHSGTNAPDIQISGESVYRTPGVPATPKKTVEFQDGADFVLTIDVKTLKGTFAYKNSTQTQPVSCSTSGDGKYW